MLTRFQAVWEMTNLIIAPKKVFRNIYYHVCTKRHHTCTFRRQDADNCTETSINPINPDLSPQLT